MKVPASFLPQRHFLLGVVLPLVLASEADGFVPRFSTSKLGVRCTRPSTIADPDNPLATDPTAGVNYLPISLERSAVSTGEDDNDGAPTKRFWSRRWVPVSTAVIIGSFSVLEILESSRELLAKWHIQHWRAAHGITILAILRLGRSIAILQTEAEELEEQVVGRGEVEAAREKTASSLTGARKKLMGFLRTINRSIARFITSPMVAITACIMAAVASFVEIVDDMRPGAHHGAALLALSELYYQIRRFKNVTGRKRLIPFKIPLGIPIALAAAIFAAFELYEDIQPGAHHGLAILALAELVENINRSKVLH